MTDLPHRDIEKVYSVSDFVAKLRRLADALEQQGNIRDYRERLRVAFVTVEA